MTRINDGGFNGLDSSYCRISKPVMTGFNYQVEPSGAATQDGRIGIAGNSTAKRPTNISPGLEHLRGLSENRRYRNITLYNRVNQKPITKGSLIPTLYDEEASYVQWINYQLTRSRPRIRIWRLADENLRNGVAYAHLLKVLGDINLPLMNPRANTFHEKTFNIHLVLNELNRHRVNMHRLEPDKIVNGDLQSIMRLVLAIAAHFAPQTVRVVTEQRPYSLTSSSTSNNSSPNAATADINNNTSHVKINNGHAVNGARGSCRPLKQTNLDDVRYRRCISSDRSQLFCSTKSHQQRPTRETAPVVTFQEHVPSVVSGKPHKSIGNQRDGDPPEEHRAAIKEALAELNDVRGQLLDLQRLLSTSSSSQTPDSNVDTSLVTSLRAQPSKSTAVCK